MTQGTDPGSGGKRGLTRKRQKRQEWPEAKVLGPECVKWRVLVGRRLGDWRREMGNKQEVAAQRANLSQDVLSRIETGKRHVELCEIVALAMIYRKRDKIGDLFRAPTKAEWESILRVYEKDPRYDQRP